MPKKNQTDVQVAELENFLSQELLGKVPLFFQQVTVKGRNGVSTGPIRYSRKIKITAYQTEAYETRAYHKAISKII